MDVELVSIASLMISMASVWSRTTWLWSVPFAAFVATGLAGDWIGPAALGSVLALFLILRSRARACTRRARIVATALLAFAALVLGLHLAPGFGTAVRLADVGASMPAAWDGVRFTADKPLAGLFLLLAYRERLCRSGALWRRALAVTALPTFLGIVGVYAVGVAIGHIRFEPTAIGLSSLPPIAVLLARNLFFTVVAEEMLFRQVLQASLERAWRGRGARAVALLIASVSFGLVHLPGGAAFALLATLAGLVYGYAFMASARIETAMAAHVLLNVGNVLLLSPVGAAG